MPTRGGMQFLVSYRGQTGWVGHADREELSALVSLHGDANPRGHLDVWSLISFRFLGFPEPEIHALGLLRCAGCVWITSRIVSLSENSASIVTWSGSRYDLGQRGDPELAPELRAHLRYALLTWGFKDITD